MAQNSLAHRFFAWPEAKEWKVDYKPPISGSNPAIKGFALRVAAHLVRIPIVAGILHKNAGLQLGKTPGLGDVENRFDPTVIPILGQSDGAPPSPASVSDLESPPRHKLTNPAFYSIRDYHAAYKAGTFTPLDVVHVLLPLIQRVPGQVPKGHKAAFLDVKSRLILDAAEASTQRWAKGDPLGPLDGVPLAVKDELDLHSYTRSFASRKVFGNGEENSWCVQQWLDAGAVILGKSTMHEFGMDTTNNNPYFGTPVNPYASSYYTGGSSGGGAHSVASGLVPAAMGCDGGGSVRIPSAYCGVYGLKCSHNRIPKSPTPNASNTTIVVGPIAADMESLNITYRIMATPKPNVSHSTLFPPPGAQLHSESRQKLIGIFKPWYANCDPAVKTACDDAIQNLIETAGYRTVDITIPHVSLAQIAHALTITAECGAALYDYSFMQPANRIVMRVGERSSSRDYLSAQKIRNIVMQHLAFLFEKHGRDLLIVTPTTPNPGVSFTPADLKVGLSDADATILSMQYVWLANFTGCPAITVPVGYAEAKSPKPATKSSLGPGHVPIGLMATGIWGSEDNLIEFGFDCEAYLHNGVAGGRRKPTNFCDVHVNAIGAAATTATTTEPTTSVASSKITDKIGAQPTPIASKSAEFPTDATTAAPKVETTASTVSTAPAPTIGGSA